MEREVPDEKLREFFNQLTANSGGKLSIDGFLKLNYELYLNRTVKEAKEQFRRLDKDDNDSLDFEEVKALLKENWVLLPERRKELRAQLDKFSNDEYLDMKMLCEILTKLGNDPIDEDDVNSFISDLDWNADGRISKDELTVFLLRGHEWNTGNQTIESSDEKSDKSGDESSDTEELQMEKNHQEDETSQGEEEEVEKMLPDDELPNEKKPTKDESSSSDSDSSDDEKGSRSGKNSDDEKASQSGKKSRDKKASRSKKKSDDKMASQPEKTSDDDAQMNVANGEMDNLTEDE